MYQALYRKWRPRAFDDVIGQEHITEILKRQTQLSRFSHAYLFTGTRGTGKTSCAKILARAINCESPLNGNPCNKCPSCIGIEGGSILDVVELDAASNNGVDNVRAIRDEAVYTPAVVKKRVYIVDEVHMLSAAAFNALLKIIEEPPEHLVFILATTELHKVPKTILSRCQRYSFKRIRPDEIEKSLLFTALQEGILLAPDAAALLSRLADGSMRDALSLLDQCSTGGDINLDRVQSAIGLAGAAETAKLLISVLRRNAGEALTIFEDMYKNGKDAAAVLDELNGMARDLLISRIAPRRGLSLISGALDDQLLNNFPEATNVRLLFCISQAQAAMSDIGRRGNPRITSELCIIRMCDENLSEDYAAITSRLSELERKVDGSGLVPAQPSTSDFAAQSPEMEDVTPEKVQSVEDIPPWEEPQIPDEAEETVPSPDQPGSPFDDLWAKVLDRVKDSLDIAAYSLLRGGAGAKLDSAGEVLTIYAGSEFEKGVISNEKVMAPVRTAVFEVRGKPVVLKVEVSEDRVKSANDKLDTLGRFKNVEFN